MCESWGDVLGVCLGEVRNKPAPNLLSEARRPGMAVLRYWKLPEGRGKESHLHLIEALSKGGKLCK